MRHRKRESTSGYVAMRAPCTLLRLGVQEISDLLANRLTNDEEGAVQEELRALQAEAVSTSCQISVCDSHLGMISSLDKQSLKCMWNCPLRLARFHLCQKVRAIHDCLRGHHSHMLNRDPTTAFIDQ